MRNGQCPKCNSTTIYSLPQGVYFYAGNAFHVHTGSLSMGIAYVSFVCTTCGYFENYIADPNRLAEVASKWQKVPVYTP